MKVASDSLIVRFDKSRLDKKENRNISKYVKCQNYESFKALQGKQGRNLYFSCGLVDDCHSEWFPDVGSMVLNVR